MSLPEPGDHLVSPRSGYTHHGIYVGNGNVVHYSGFGDGINTGPVEETTIEKFSAGRGYSIKEHRNKAYTVKTSIERARSRVGEDLYSLFSNNCEHFVNWCIDGKHQSTQVDIGTSGTSGALSTVSGVAGRAAVASTGVVAGTSGSGVMSGLAAIGGTVGGGAVAGLGVIGGSGGIAAASLLNNTVLKDNEALDDDERDARAIGRKATYAGAAAG